MKYNIIIIFTSVLLYSCSNSSDQYNSERSAIIIQNPQLRHNDANPEMYYVGLMHTTNVRLNEKFDTLYIDTVRITMAGEDSIAIIYKELWYKVDPVSNGVFYVSYLRDVIDVNSKKYFSNSNHGEYMSSHVIYDFTKVDSLNIIDRNLFAKPTIAQRHIFKGKALKEYLR